MLHAECAEGEVCNFTAESPDQRLCHPSECDGLFDDTSCGEGFKCVPALEGVVLGEPVPSVHAATPTGSFLCVEVIDEPIVDEEVCEFYGDCEAGTICYNSGPEESHCLSIDCTTESADVECPTEMSCITNDFLSAMGVGTCWSDECDPFGDPTGCAEGEMCRGLASTSAVAETPQGECAEAGTLLEGETCGEEVEAECADGMICLDGECRHPCLLDAVTGDPGVCAEGSVCLELNVEGTPLLAIGGCVPNDCDPTTTGECAEGEQCVAAGWGFTGEAEVVFGRCLESTSDGALGDACEINEDCVEGLICDGVCRAYCERAGGDTDCAEGETCFAAWGETSPIGLCRITCEPFAADGGCEATEKCLPLYEDITTGFCWEAGDGDEGSACEASNECTNGMLCVDGACTRVCDAAAEAGGPGACLEDEACAALYVDNEIISFGMCTPSCTIEDDSDSCPAGMRCFWRGWTSSNVDACVGGSDPLCDASNVGYICDDFSGCFDIEGWTDGSTCLELCRESVGDFLTLGHPDCTAPNAICDPLFTTRELPTATGVCLDLDSL